MTGGGVSGPGVGLGLVEMHVIFQCFSHELFAGPVKILVSVKRSRARG